MPVSNVITKPLLRGTIGVTSRWQAIFARPGYQVYPYPPGCLVRQDTGGVTATVKTHGMGSFAVSDYVMACRPVSYGDSTLYIPQPTLISSVSALGTTEDELVLNDMLNLYSGDWLFNLGTDTASPSASVTPNFDGSNITIYSDNVGTNSTGLAYMTTGRHGVYSGWITAGFEVVDLLITNPSNTMIVVFPVDVPGPEVLSV